MRLIDADRLINEFEDTVGSPITRTRLKLQVQNQPTIDAVEVVRCKDCKYFDGECCDRYADETLGYSHSTQQNFFCAVGERRTDDSQMQSDKIRQK